MSHSVQENTSDLWDPSQEWIQIFDKLMKHPGGAKKGCSCDICQARKTSSRTGHFHAMATSVFQDRKIKRKDKQGIIINKNKNIVFYLVQPS